MRGRLLVRQFLHREDGLILPLILVLLALGMLAITPTLGHAYTSSLTESVTEERSEELYAADAGLEEALRWLIDGHETNSNWTWDDDTSVGSRTAYMMNDASVDVTVSPIPSLGTHYYRVDSVATGPRGTTTVLSQVWVAPGALSSFDDIGPSGTYDGDVYIDGDDRLKAHQQVNGNVIVTGDLTLNAQTGIDGSVSVAGDYVQHAHTHVTGDVCAGGNVTMKAHSDLTGAIYLELDDGESATIQFQGQAHSGDIFITTTGSSASVDLWLGNKDVVGDIYVTPEVSLSTTFHKKSTHGPIDLNWDGENPPPPDCPDLPGPAGAEIQTYEIL